MIRHELRMPHPTEASRFVVWDLSAGERRVENAAGAVVSTGPGPIVLNRGIEGMGHPKVDVFSRTAPRRPGRTRTGTRGEVRSAFLPIYLDLRGNDWVMAQRFFWECLSPDRVATWRVTAPDSTWRELPVYLDPEDTKYSLDPSDFATVLGLSLVADDPFWLGPEQVGVTVAEASSTPFFGTGGAPPFNITSGSSSGWAEFSILGDVEVWPLLEVVGEASGFRIAEQSGSMVSGAVTVPDGQKLVIDFDPLSQAAMLRPVSSSSGGTNVTGQLTDRRFFPIRPSFPGVQIIELSMIGAGEARLSYRPRYWRAV